MSPTPALTDAQLAALRQLDSCAVANAIERFDVRLRNTGFADSTIRARFPALGTTVGYAATARLRSGEPPVEGGWFRDRTDWWSGILAVPAPRVVVLQDMDEPPGRGAFLGDTHAAVLRALGCVGFVSNGAARELPRIEALGLQVFSASVAVSHAYTHVFDIGAEIEVGGLAVRTGDLLHGDQHGLVNVPMEIAAEIPATAAELRRHEACVIELCRSPDFTVEKLRALLQSLGSR